jgi:hypothetical protein
MDPYSEPSDDTLSVLPSFSTPYPDEIEGDILIDWSSTKLRLSSKTF